MRVLHINTERTWRGGEQHRPMKITARIQFPEGGLITPTGEVYHASEESMYIKLEEESFYGFGFDETWEIVPGDWKFQIKYKNAIIAQKTLTVLTVVAVDTVDTAADPSADNEPDKPK